MPTRNSIFDSRSQAPILLGDGLARTKEHSRLLAKIVSGVREVKEALSSASKWRLSPIKRRCRKKRIDSHVPTDITSYSEVVILSYHKGNIK